MPAHRQTLFHLEQKEYSIHISGTLLHNEWIISVRAKAPMSAWGYNKFNTHTDNKRNIIRRCIMELLNELSPFDIDKKPLILAINEIS